MNYLAHCFLSCQEEDLLIGNFIADNIKNKDLSNYSQRIQDGVYLHRKIDTYTDNHPIVRQGTARLHQWHHKYSAVVIDIYFDYLLVNNWAKYSGQDLPSWTKNIYKILTRRADDLPEKLQKNLPIMINHNWLMRYGTEEGLRFTFGKMKRRVKIPSYFENATVHLLENQEAFNEEFNLFFPDLIAYVEKECLCQ